MNPQDFYSSINSEPETLEFPFVQQINFHDLTKNINPGPEIDDNMKKTISEFIERVRENPMSFLASAGLIIIVLGLLINIIYSFYNRKPIKKNKNTYKDFKMIELYEI